MPSEPAIQRACEVDFGALYRERMLRSARTVRRPEDWDARAPKMTRGAFDSEYVRAFVARMDLEGCRTLLDVGCGPGNIGLSVAARLDHVYGLDFSPGMLDAFQEQARARGAGNVTPVLRSWGDDWAGVPACDIVVASRSTLVADLEAAMVKVIARTRVRAYVTYPADGHFMTGTILRAIGRADDGLPDFVCLVGLLRNLGVFPRLDYLPGRSRLAGCETFDDLLAKVTDTLVELTAGERERLREYFDAAGGRVGREPARWALVSWEAGAGQAWDARAVQPGGPAT